MVAPPPAQPADLRSTAQIIPFSQFAHQPASRIYVSTARSGGRCDGPAPVLSLAGHRAVTHPMAMPAAADVWTYTVDRTDPDWTPRHAAQAAFLARHRETFAQAADWAGIAGLYLAAGTIAALALKALAAAARLGWL